jgi:putative Mn2+ efflux pump MntP
MDLISLFGIAVGLSMDAFAVSIANGAACNKLRFSFALKLGGAFGLFQALMPFVGWCIGRAGEAIITAVDHWIALVLLGFLGGKMIWEAVRHKEDDEPKNQEDIALKTLLLLAVATSIDALATGIILPSAVGASTFLLMLLAIAIIGAVTFCICVPACYLGKKFGSLLSSKAEIFGGLVLIAIGVKIFVEHQFFS